MNGIVVLAGREVSEALRNRWILAAALCLGGLAVLLALVGTTPGGAVRAAPLSVAVANLSSLSVYLVPLLALLLSFDALVGESENGTLNLLLTYPIARWQLVAGKFIGYLIVLGVALLLGYGGAGLLVGYRADSTDGWQIYTAMMAMSLSLGAVFLALGFVVSAIARERAAAIGACIVMWLAFVVLYDLALLGALVLDEGQRIDPGVLGALLVANPTDAYRLATLASTDAMASVTGMAGLARDAGVGWFALLGSLAAWTALPVAVAMMIFQRREA